ncbi:hypothetical protein ACOME3_009722 [Neoechinorhynchus agilis]
MDVSAHVKFNTAKKDTDTNWLRCTPTISQDCTRLLIRYQTAQSNCLPVEINEQAPSRDVVVRRSEYEKGLGLSIKGGKESQMPIVVSRVFAGMAADRSSQIRVGDAILSVNGISLADVLHTEAVRLLRDSGNVIKLKVQQMKNWITNNEFVIDLRGCRMSPQTGYLCLTISPPNDDLCGNGGCVLRFRQMSIADDFIAHLRHSIDISTNEHVGSLLTSKVHKCGWLQQSRVWHDVQQKQNSSSYFVVIDNETITAYHRYPPSYSMQAWSWPLLNSRLMQSIGCPNSISIRSGTRDGLMIKRFQPDDPRDIHSWCLAFLNATNEAATAIEFQTFDCKQIDGSTAKLILNIKQGLSLHNIGCRSIQLSNIDQYHTSKSSGKTSQVIWKHPFADIEHTSDDGIRWLTVHFANREDVVRLNLASSLKPFIFHLHNFLQMKLMERHLIEPQVYDPLDA